MVYSAQEILDLHDDLDRKDEQKPTIAVWFSCGAASAVASYETLKQYGDRYQVLIVNNPVKEEHEDNRRFLKDVSKWLKHPIIEASNINYPDNSIQSVFKKAKYMSGVKGAPCTKQLKKEARYQFEKVHKIDYHVLGFTLDEKERHERFIKFERPNVFPVLINSKITKQDCFNILAEAGVKLPDIYANGFPNANCVGCVKATSPTYWNLVRKVFPKVFTERAEQSREIGCRLVRVKGKRLFLDELPAEAVGGRLKSYECGIFCETKVPKTKLSK